MRTSTLLLCMALAACGDTAPAPSGKSVLRIGHFPNVTHAHGLIAHQLSRQGKGWFEERLGDGVTVEWFVYNAGPSAMEAILADSLDLTYVGPSPALNAYVRSQGSEVRVLAGATYGGAALVVGAGAGIATPADFRGKSVATPQLGNTQDVACRAWLVGNGFSVTQTGGDVTVVPTQNADVLPLLQSGDIQAAWTVEPWVSQLEMDAGARVFLEETDACTTILIASERLSREQPEIAARVRQAHEELSAWIVAHEAEAKELIRAEITADTQTTMPPELLDRCWPRLRFSSEIALETFQDFVSSAQASGFMQDAGDLSRLVLPR